MTFKKMPKAPFYLFIFSLTVFLVSCAPFKRMISPGSRMDQSAGILFPEDYSGPRVKVSLADFDIKAGKAGGDIGPAMRDLLAAMLSGTSRFTVVERQSPASEKQRQEAAPADTADSGGKTENKNADLIIAVTVTEFEPQSSGGASGVGAAGGVGSGLMGGLLGTSLNKAHMAVDVHIIDAQSSKVLAANRVRGQATEALSSDSPNSFVGSGYSGALSIYENTPMEKAIRFCLVEAVRYIADNVPQQYYKY